MILKHKILALLGMTYQIKAMTGLLQFSNQNNNDLKEQSETTDGSFESQQLHPMHYGHLGLSGVGAGLAAMNLLKTQNENTRSESRLHVERLRNEDYSTINKIKSELKALYADLNQYDKDAAKGLIKKDTSKRILQSLKNIIDTYIVKNNIDMKILNEKIGANQESILYDITLILELAIMKSNSFINKEKIEALWYNSALDIFEFICNNYHSKYYQDPRIIASLTTITNRFLITPRYYESFKFNRVYNSSTVLEILSNLSNRVVPKLIYEYLNYTLSISSQRIKDPVIANEELINYLSMMILYKKNIPDVSKEEYLIQKIRDAFKEQLPYFYKGIKDEILSCKAKIGFLEAQTSINISQWSSMRDRITDLEAYVAYMETAMGCNMLEMDPRVQSFKESTLDFYKDMERWDNAENLSELVEKSIAKLYKIIVKIEYNKLDQEDQLNTHINGLDSSILFAIAYMLLQISSQLPFIIISDVPSTMMFQIEQFIQKYQLKNNSNNADAISSFMSTINHRIKKYKLYQQYHTNPK